MSFHMTRVYYSFEQFASNQVNPKKARKAWKKHVEKHGDAPMIVKCSICSGEGQKKEIKLGMWKPKRPNKEERAELRGDI